MYQVILILHVVFAIALIALVLMQQGKGATAGAAFGAGASGTVFGSQGSGSFMFKLTALFGVLFFVTSLTLTHMATSEIRQMHKQDILTQVTQLSKEQKAQDESATNEGAKKAINQISK